MAIDILWASAMFDMFEVFVWGMGLGMLVCGALALTIVLLWRGHVNGRLG